MTAAEIAQHATTLSGIPINPEQIIPFINDLLFELGERAGSFTTVTYSNSDSDVWYTLPPSLTDPAIIRVYKVYDVNDREVEGWDTDYDRIRFLNNGDFKVKYYRVPAKVKTGDDKPDCHELLHPAFAYYCLFRLEKDPTDEDALAWLSDYYRKIETALLQRPKKSRKMKVAAWR